MKKLLLAWSLMSLMCACGSPRPVEEVDGGLPDGGGVPDAGLEGDGGLPDAGGFDGGVTDAGQVDGGFSDGGFSCPLRPACEVTFTPPSRRSFKHTTSQLTASLGSARHRGRDLFVKAGQPQWLIGKFAYGTLDKDIKDEEVDVFLLRGCAGSWESVGTFLTTNDGTHPTVEGVVDTGGRVYVDLSTKVAPLGVGRHRAKFVVAGDGTMADVFLEVLPAQAKVVVTDIDGTLTVGETSAFASLFGGAHPDANPGSADVMTELAHRGFFIFYLTARPEYFVAKTREWLSLKQFPPGIIHTTTDGTGALGQAAIAYKTGELSALQQSTGLLPEYAFGNTDTDAAAYAASGIAPARSYYFELTGDAKGGVVHQDYRTLVPVFHALGTSCP